MATNVLQVEKVGDFGAQNLQANTNVDARQNVQLINEPLISYIDCYGPVLM